MRKKLINPVTDLPAARDLAALLEGQPELRNLLVHLLFQLGEQADGLAEHSWEKRKAPMAAYWRACAVYARHTARSIKQQTLGFTDGEERERL
jgi:hypothetical protein